MAKTLTKLQEQIVARVLAIGASEYVWLQKGHIHSMNNLKQKGLVTENAWTCLQRHHLTENLRSLFWADNDIAFAIEDLYGHRYMIFYKHGFIGEAKHLHDAKRLVSGLKLLHDMDRKQAA
jgi:hypothetical protein